MQQQNQEYAGFWIRTGAAIIDAILILIVVTPVLTYIYGDTYWLSESYVRGFWDLLLSYIMPAIAFVIFWIYKSATPGKMATKHRRKTNCWSIHLSIPGLLRGHAASLSWNYLGGH